MTSNLQVDMEKPYEDTLGTQKLTPFFQHLLPFKLWFEEEKYQQKDTNVKGNTHKCPQCYGTVQVILRLNILRLVHNTT